MQEETLAHEPVSTDLTPEKSDTDPADEADGKVSVCNRVRDMSLVLTLPAPRQTVHSPAAAPPLIWLPTLFLYHTYF